MSPKAPPAPRVLPKVKRAMGPSAVFKLSVKILQQQLTALQDRELSSTEKDFVITSMKALDAVRKRGPAAAKDEVAQGGESGRDPLKLLRG